MRSTPRLRIGVDPAGWLGHSRLGVGLDPGRCLAAGDAVDLVRLQVADRRALAGVALALVLRGHWRGSLLGVAAVASANPRSALLLCRTKAQAGPVTCVTGQAGQRLG